MIAPWLSATDADRAVDFYRDGFGATVVEHLRNDEGGLEVAELAIGEARFWVQRDPTTDTSRSPVRMILTVADPEAAFARALAAGATEVVPVHDGHGWRVGRLADPAGHHWELGKPLHP